MPYGIWQETDWPRPASAVAWTIGGPSVLFERTPDWDPSWGLEKIETEPSSLLGQLGNIRQSKREERSQKHAVPIADKLPRRPHSSAATYSLPAGSVDKKGTKKKDHSVLSTEGEAGSNLRRTEQAVKTWNLKEKAARIPESTLRYALPENTIIFPNEAKRKRLHDARDSLVRVTYEETLNRLSQEYTVLDFEDNEGNQRVNRTELSVYGAAKELAESNVSLSAVKDLLDRFQNPEKTIFTKEYVMTQHLYGTMCDYIRDLWVTTVNLSRELEYDSMEMLDEHTKVNMRKFGDSDAMLAAWLKMVLDTLNSLQWDSVKQDFQRWCRNATEQENALSDAIAFIGDQMDEALNLLSISRYAIEEALGKHILIAANQLMKFHESMTKWTDSPDRPERTMRSLQRKGSGGSNNMDQRLHQLLVIAQEEKERQRRNLELNQSLMKSKMAEKAVLDNEVKPARPPSPSSPSAQKAKTVMVNAQGSPVHKPKQMEETTRKREFMQVHLPAKPLAHVSDIYGRCMDQCKAALETIEKAKKERDKLLLSAKKFRLKRRKEERIAKLRKQRRAIDQAVDLHPRTPSKRSTTVREIEKPAIELHDTTKNLSSSQVLWSSESYRTDDASEEQMQKVRQIECDRLMRKKQELYNKLNCFSMKVSLASVWGSFVKMHGTVEEMNVMQKVAGQVDGSPKGVSRGASGELLSRQDSARSLHSEGTSLPPSVKSEASSVGSADIGRCESQDKNAELDGDVPIEEMLETCADLERQGIDAEKELQLLCESNVVLVKKVERRFGADMWQYTPGDNEEGPCVWFKLNPRYDVMNVIVTGLAKLLLKGALLLGREGEQQLKAFSKDLKTIGRSMEQEHEERLQSAKGPRGDSHAAYEFVNARFDMLLRRFSSTWKGLQDRVRLADEMENAMEIAVEDPSDGEHSDPASSPPSEYSEGDASHNNSTAVAMEANTMPSRTLQAKLLSTQTESNLKKVFLKKTEAESETLEKQTDGVRKVMVRRIQIEAARAKDYEAKKLIKELVREIELARQEIIRGKRYGFKKDPDASPTSSNNMALPSPRIRLSTTSGTSGASSLHVDGMDEDLRLSSLSGSDLQGNSSGSLVAERSRLTRKSMFEMQPMANPASSMRIEQKMTLNKDKFRVKIEKAQKAEAVLKMRAVRRKEELRRVLAVLKKLGYGEIEGLPQTKDELQEKWDKEITNVKSQLVTVNKVLKHWRGRMDQRYEEIRLQYGEEVLMHIKDYARRNTKDGKLALLDAMRRKSLEGFIDANGGPLLSRPSSARTAATTSAFNEAYQTLGELDPTKMSTQVYGSRNVMLRKIDQAIRQLTELEMAGVNRLGDGIPDYSEERQHLLVLQSFFQGTQTSAGKSQVATLGGGLHTKRESTGRIFRSALGATDLHAGIDEDVLGMLGEDTAIVGKAVKGVVKGHALHRVRRELTRRSGSRKGTKSSIDLTLSVVGKRGTVESSPAPSEKDSDEDSEDEGLFKKARGSLFLYKKLQRKSSKQLRNLDGLNKKWTAEQRSAAEPRENRQTVMFADTIEFLSIRNKQLAARHQDDKTDDAFHPCNERVQMLRLFMDDSADPETQKKEKRLRFQERVEVINSKPRKNRLALPTAKPPKRPKDASKAMAGLLDFRQPKHMTRRKTWKLNHDVGQESSAASDDCYQLEVKAERCAMCRRQKEAVFNRLMMNPIEAARASIHSSMASSRNSSQSSFYSDDYINPWQEAACNQQGIQLLRACRERLLQEFGSFEQAFERATLLPGSQKDGFMYFDAFDWLTGVVGFDEMERRFMFDHVTLAAGLEKNSEKIEKAQFADVLRSAVPLSNLAHLRFRLLQRFGRVADAFDTSSHGEPAMSPAAFCKMLETVNGDASEARQLFAQIEIHNECSPAKGSHRQVTRRAVLKCLRLAEHLAAARKLCQHLYTVHKWLKEPGDDDALLIEGGGNKPVAPVPSAPEDGDIEQLVAAYNTLIQLVDIRYINKRLDLEHLKKAVRSISLSREDVHWLYRLCSRDSKDGFVSIQEIAIRALGGLGHRCKDLALRVGQEAKARGCARCKTFTALAIKNALGESVPQLRLSLGIVKLSQSDDEQSSQHVPAGSRRKTYQSTGAFWRQSKIARRKASKAVASELDSGVEAGVDASRSDLEDHSSANESSRRSSRQQDSLPPTSGRLAPSGRSQKSRSTSPVPKMRRDRPGAEMEPLGAGKRHWSWWLDYGVRAKKLRPREVFHRSRKSWSRSVVPPHRRHILSPALTFDRTDSVVVTDCSDQEGEIETSFRGSPSPESVVRKNTFASTVQDESDRDRSDSEGQHSGSDGGGTSNTAVEHDSKVSSRVQRRSSSKSTSTKPRPKGRMSTSTSTSIPRRPESRSSCWSRERYRSLERGDVLEVTSKEVDSKDPTPEDEATKWRFKDNQERRGFKRRQGSSERQAGEDKYRSTERERSDSDGRSDSNSIVKDSRSPTPTGATRRACESPDVKRPQLRLALFSGDIIELQTATQRMQDFRFRLLTRFRTPAKAFEVLAGAKSTKLDVDSLQTKIEKFLSFNPLDARRIITLLSGSDEVREVTYANFLRLMRFAMPVNSVLEFRTRLVQMFGRVDVAFREIGFLSNEYDIGTFEKPMLSAGIVSGDARRIFRVVDAVHPGGPCGQLMPVDFERALDNAHILAWLEAFYARAVGSTKGHTIFDVLLHESAANEEAPFSDADAFEELLAEHGFPTEYVPATFAFLIKMCSPNQVTLGAFANMLNNAFGTVSVTRRSKDRVKMQKQVGTQPVLGMSARQAKAKLGVARPLMLTMTMGKHSPPGEASSEQHAPLTDEARLASAIAAADAVREEALVHTRQLRRQVMFSFANYQEAYDVFEKKRPQEGVAFDEWMEAMVFFGFSDASRWENVFGHMVKWQHPHWDPRCAEGRVTISILANSLDQAAPCVTPLALRVVLQEKYGTLQKAWAQLTGKDGVEEMSTSSWKRALQQVRVMGDDAGYLHSMLRAAPIAERSSDVRCPNLSRVAFMATMRGAESLTRLFELLECLRKEHGPVSSAFEANSYSQEPLQTSAFEEELAALLETTVTETRTLFAYLDFYQDGLVSIDDLLDALTVMQATFLPNRRAREEAIREVPKRLERQGHSSLLEETIEEHARRSRSATMSPAEVEATGRSSSELTRATTSPMDLKVPPYTKGGSAASGHNSIHRISTALPDSDSESMDEDARSRQQRPWTSMAFTGDGTQRQAPPHAGGTLGSSSLQSNAARLEFLPHLDLAAARNTRILDGVEDQRRTASSFRRFSSEWTPRSTPSTELGTKASDTPDAPAIGVTASADKSSPQALASRASPGEVVLGLGIPELPNQRHPELPTLAGVMAVQPVVANHQGAHAAPKRATRATGTLGKKANVPSCGGFRRQRAAP